MTRIVLVIEDIAYSLTDKGELRWNSMGTEAGWCSVSNDVVPDSWIVFSPAEVVKPAVMARRALIKAALETAETSQL